MHSTFRPLIFFFLLLPATAFAGAWTQKENAFQLITTASIYGAGDFFDAQGNEVSQRTFYKQELSVYAEYGLKDDLTIGGQLTFARAFQETAAGQDDSNWNLGDTEIFIRQRLWKDNLNVISLQPYLVLPSPDSFTTHPKIGSDDHSIGLRANYGRNFKLFDRWHYADLSTAYQYRSGNVDDQWKLDATLGLNINETWQLLPQIFITQSLGDIQGTSFTNSPADDYDMTKLQLSVQYRYSPSTAFQLGYFNVVDGRNTGAGQGGLLSYVGNF